MNKNKEKIIKKSKSYIGKSFDEIDTRFILTEEGNKGALGHVIEENVLGYSRNSNPQKDLPEADMEVKVTPYKKNKNGTYSAKERLVLNIINYMTEYKYSFYESSFWDKNSSLLLFLYEHIENIDRKDFTLSHVYEMSYDKNELKIIMQDFETIRHKILEGKAHEISEGDTMYLGACTKGATALSSFREQPFSTVRAKQRAYSFKTTFMTQKIREILASKKNETIFIDDELNLSLSFEQNIILRIKEFFGKTEKELRNQFEVSGSSKAIYEILFGKMLRVKGKISKTDEFLKADIVPKFIRLKKDGNITESMSFPTFKFTEIFEHEFEESEVYDYFTSKKFLFVIFEYNSNNELYFSRIKLWNLPMTIIENELRKVYDYTRDLIKEGNIVRYIDNNDNRITNFPGKDYNDYFHIRPHARNKSDVYDLPVADRLTNLKEFTKQCFWLNNNYIKQILSE
ncbi:MAG: Sau3AI family type II restriction endonuclease [Gudongella sp.]|nr:Sau3AI family type II restriction endonuclease [Gudongella sp.]